MNARIDLTGQRFGGWLVLRPSHEHTTPNGTPRWYWLCRCDCGVRRAVSGHTLRGPVGHGSSRQCRDCRNAEAAARGRAMSRRVGDGRTVAQIAHATGLKVDTVYHRLIRGWKPHELGMRPLAKNERRA